MKNFRAPGVYVIEDQATPMPLSGVPTGIPCFFGFTHQGPSLSPTRITSLNEFFSVFGAQPKNRTVFPNAQLVNSLYAFFLNGGGECYVCRTNGGSRVTWPVVSVQDVVDFKKLEDPFHPSSPDSETPALISFGVSAISGGSWANELRIRAFRSTTQAPRPVISTVIPVALPESEPFKSVSVRRLKPTSAIPLPPIEGLEGAVLTIGGESATWTGPVPATDENPKIEGAFVFESAQTNPGSGVLEAKLANSDETVQVSVRYIPDTSIDPKLVGDPELTDEERSTWHSGWNVKTRIVLENVDTTSSGKTTLTASWDPETARFYLVDGDGNQFVLTQDAVIGAEEAGEGAASLEGELQEPLRLKDPTLALNFDLVVLEPVPPRSPGDATSYRPLEVYSGLSTDPNDPQYFLKAEGVVNGISKRIELSAFEEGGQVVAFGTNAIEGATLVSPSAPGGAKAENLGEDAIPAPTDYANYFPLLKACPDVSLIACPDAYLDGPSTDAFVYQPIFQAAINYAFDNRCMVVIDPPPQAPALELGDLTQRSKALETFADRFRSTHAAIYAPWFESASLDPESDAKTTFVPPSGFILGAYNRSDNNVGVWKAPANIPVLGALGLQLNFTEEDSEVLNPAGVNLTRSFPGQGLLIWGARTTTKNVMWRYVNVRRLFLYVERTLKQETSWAVFESNDQRTWNKLVNGAEAFLRGIWRDGGLMGATPQEAFQVSCGVPQTMTMEDVFNGLLRVEIKIAPVRPAEFIVFTVSQLVQQQTS